MTFLRRATERIAAVGDEVVEFMAEVSDFRELGWKDGVRFYQIALTRSAFTPRHCSGSMIATSRTGHALKVEVLAVEEDAEGTLWHTTQKPLQPGIAVQGYLPPLKDVPPLK